MSLHERIVKELGYSMNMPNETDVAFVALWVSRRADGSLNSTACNIEEEPLTDELRERIAIVLRNLADTVCPTMRAPDPPSALVCTCGLSEHYKTLHVPPCPLARR
jgi:hypothetical protein